MTRASSQDLTTQIVESLGAAIVSGTHGAGNSFAAEVLRGQYGTSRCTLREALKVLGDKGLVGARPRHGTWIEPEENWNWLDPDVLRWSHDRRFSYSLQHELAEFRLAFEPKAAGLAARVASREHLDMIERTFARLIASESREDDPLSAELAFHIAVVRGGRNRFFSQLGGVTESALRFSIRFTTRLRGTRQDGIAGHARIHDSIVARDPTSAELAMRELIQETLDLIDRAESEVKCGPTTTVGSVSDSGG